MFHPTFIVPDCLLLQCAYGVYRYKYGVCNVLTCVCVCMHVSPHIHKFPTAVCSRRRSRWSSAACVCVCVCVCVMHVSPHIHNSRLLSAHAGGHAGHRPCARARVCVMHVSPHIHISLLLAIRIHISLLSIHISLLLSGPHRRSRWSQAACSCYWVAMSRWGPSSSPSSQTPCLRRPLKPPPPSTRRMRRATLRSRPRLTRAWQRRSQVRWVAWESRLCAAWCILHYIHSFTVILRA